MHTLLQVFTASKLFYRELEFYELSPGIKHKNIAQCLSHDRETMTLTLRLYHRGSLSGLIRSTVLCLQYFMKLTESMACGEFVACLLA